MASAYWQMIFENVTGYGYGFTRVLWDTNLNGSRFPPPGERSSFLDCESWCQSKSPHWYDLKASSKKTFQTTFSPHCSATEYCISGSTFSFWSVPLKRAVCSAAVLQTPTVTNAATGPTKPRHLLHLLSIQHLRTGVHGAFWSLQKVPDILQA